MIFSKKIQFLSISAMLLAAYLNYPFVFAADKKIESNTSQISLPQVFVEKPEIVNITEWDNFTGRFVAINAVDIRSRVTGYLEKIHFKDGQIVQQGEVLFTIDKRPFEAEVAIAKASVAEKLATLTLARAELARSLEVYKKNLVSKQQLDQDEAQVQQVEAQVAEARARLNKAELELSFTEITAPISGQIDAHNIDVGNLIKGDDDEGTPLTNIVSLDPIYIVFDIAQNAFVEFAKRQSGSQANKLADNLLRVSLQGAPQVKHNASIDFVSNSIDQRTGSIRVRAVTDNQQGVFTPGLFAQVELAKQADSAAMLLPQQAVFLEQTQHNVFIVNHSNKVESRRVEIGPVINGKQVIRTGLNQQDRVIVSGLQRIHPGSEVNIASKMAKAPGASKTFTP